MDAVEQFSNKLTLEDIERPLSRSTDARGYPTISRGDIIRIKYDQNKFRFYIVTTINNKKRLCNIRKGTWVDQDSVWGGHIPSQITVLNNRFSEIYNM